ncbi:MAG: ABC transporter permease [Oscillospiraceae bacterium]|nr:ABC transporter permease [Oscillospiraceae bacterium]
MSKIFENFKGELFKLAARKKYLVLMIIGMLICAVPPLITSLISSLARTNVRISDVAMMNSTLLIDILLPIIIFMAVTDLFCSEFKNNNIKITLMRPISRFKVYLSKTLAVFCLVAINLCAFWVASSLLEFAFNASGALPNIAFSIAAFAVNLVPLFVLILMAALINQITNGSSLAMFLCIAVYAALQYASLFIGWANGIFFVQYMQWDRILIGTMLPFGALLSRVTLVLGYGITFFVGGLYLFNRKEF